MRTGVLRIFKWVPDIKEPYTLFRVLKDPRTPSAAKLSAFAILGIILVYTFSPIDIIPDYIPILGWMDDLILFPIGIAFAERFLPQDILLEHRVKAHQQVNRVLWKIFIAALAFIALWALILTAFVLLIMHLIRG